MKLDNKGFAITGLLYSVFTIFLIILSLLIISMTSSKLTLDKVKKEIKNDLDEEEIINNKYERLFSYANYAQEFTVPYSGWYLIELWGASGAGGENYQPKDSNVEIVVGGKGAYTSGKIHLSKDEKLYINVGQQGTIGTRVMSYNGGGYGGTSLNHAGSGGGATDIRYGGSTLYDRAMISSGGGAGYGYGYTGYGGDGGGLIGVDGTVGTTSPSLDYGIEAGKGGTQLNAGTGGQGTSSGHGPGLAGSFGIGGVCESPYGGGAGGGYYGGGAGGANSSRGGAGGGGSSFISGYAGVNAIKSSSSLNPTNNTIHYSGKYFIDGYMEAGTNSGNGKAKVTYLSEIKPSRKNSNLNKVRYIRDCILGNNSDDFNQWVEIQAIKDGINIARNKEVLSNDNINSSFKTLDYIIDGDITLENYVQLNTSNSLGCITVDLLGNYDLDEIAVWHYYDGRTYKNNVTSVSIDNINYMEVINNELVETSNGKRVNAYK